MTNIQTGQGHIFIEEGAEVEGAFLNPSNGPIYIGKNAKVMEGSKIRGPFAMTEHAVLKMDAKIYGATTLGPHVKVGGEVNNCVFTGYSNKAHDGFLGNSVIGEWCNLGADTNNSNLKNTYDNVKLWNYGNRHFEDTGLQFCGLIMGDHSKCGINTMFNTGTVIGVNVNIFGTGFPRNFVPSFSWGGAQGFKKYNLKKAYHVAEAVMKRRKIDFTEEDKAIFQHIYELEQGNE
jgi:UDP-N-acetylglucosamine diphosphorylase/glucosamine-1-phosphate N-acetyltransferase